MQLESYFTLWGWGSSAAEGVHYAKSLGFDGIEGPCPKNNLEILAFLEALNNCDMKYIQEIATTGSYVPDRSISLQEHIYYFEQEVQMATCLKSQFITCLGGCDAWDLADSITFFIETQTIAQRHNKVVSYETHRGRSLFNPWVCAKICDALPNIRLTMDLSHWCVVCEGLQESEYDLIRSFISSIHHIHARVGYDQGPQVPQPFEGVYKNDFQQHLSVWREIWIAQANEGHTHTTFTPEFGVDGYEYRSIRGDQALVDPVKINVEMMKQLRFTFEKLTDSKNIVEKS